MNKLTVLMPASYFIEMEFERPLELKTLTTALTRMGFADIVYDQSLNEPSIGALATKTTTAVARPVATVSSTPLSSALKMTSVATVAPQTAPTSPLSTVTPVSSSPLASALKATSVATVSPQRVTSPLSNVTSVQPLSSLPRTTAQVRQVAQIKRPAPTSTAFPGGFTYQGTMARPAASSPQEAPTEEAPAEASAFAPEGGPSDGGGGGGGGGDGGGGGGGDEGASQDAATSPMEEPIQASTEDATRARVRELWMRWTEWGSPFATGPSTSGEGEPLLRVRFIGTLTRPIQIQDRNGMRWLLAHRLKTNPFGALKLQSREEPHELDHGKTYEFRFLSRDKNAPTRDAVRAGLVAMGFAPMKLSAIKKHMRLPGRSGASLTLWLGLGQWVKPDSIITRDEPFFFEDVVEVKR